jgi:hypothetical protein
MFISGLVFIQSLVSSPPTLEWFVLIIHAGLLIQNIMISDD